MFNIDEIMEMEDFYENFVKNYDRKTPLVFFGCGLTGRFALKKFELDGISPQAVCDNDRSRWGTEYCGKTIESFKAVLERFSDFNVFISISCAKAYKEILEYLLEYINRDRILTFFCSSDVSYKSFLEQNKSDLEWIYASLFDQKSKDDFENVIKGRTSKERKYFITAYSENQYFPEFIKLSDSEVFADCGAFDGDTFLEFNDRTKGIFDKYYAFEPSKNTFDKLIENTSFAKEKIILFNNAVYDKNTTLCFVLDERNPLGSKVCTDSEDTVEAVSLDFVINDKVTFIKMDIEGSELAALKGAERIIKKHKPKLVISLYHKNEDIVEIPKWIMGLGLDYKLYFRHHTFTNDDSVLYAI